MILDPTIEPIFPVPTLHSHINREFTEEEIAYFNQVGKKTIKNEGNSVSHETYVLDAPEMATLKSEIDSFVKSWFTKVNINSSVEPYITQSWLNWTKKDQRHHLHNHPNSYLSGVLYITCADDDKISFDKVTYQQIRIQPEVQNEYNSDVTWFRTFPGKIILFPSEVRHQVETKKSEQVRVSMAFNTFLRGTLGKGSSLTELKL
jgi:uncharacterized protein (TIGR02466 family)